MTKTCYLLENQKIHSFKYLSNNLSIYLPKQILKIAPSFIPLDFNFQTPKIGQFFKNHISQKKLNPINSLFKKLKKMCNQLLLEKSITHPTLIKKCPNF
jgi:hypothetical protein